MKYDPNLTGHENLARFGYCAPRSVAGSYRRKIETVDGRKVGEMNAPIARAWMIAGCPLTSDGLADLDAVTL